MSRPKISREQKKRILERDNHRCVVCWRKYQLDVHHFWDWSGKLGGKDGHIGNIPYYKTRDCDLVTLCKSCHGKIHTCDKRSPLYQFVLKYLSQFIDKMKIVIIKPSYVDERFPEQPCGWRHDPEIDCLLCFMKICEDRDALQGVEEE